ncbi:MAG TPA: hypothetical protein EYP14_17970 [Planctomycetaceae bacterium]|nr:hypothetical protein [Planctomycetaceae bacterium]
MKRAIVMGLICGMVVVVAAGDLRAQGRGGRGRGMGRGVGLRALGGYGMGQSSMFGQRFGMQGQMTRNTQMMQNS